jgi:broad specificity phosphatase PhoE
MRDLVGAPTVGECRENERQIPGNGNAEQRTANGILIYRALDGRLLFSTDSRTWINGPEGLIDRPNNERFAWEGDRQIIEALQRGGYLIYFRHGATDPSQTDSDPNNLANCATQRNLTDQGRAQARAIGEALKALDIPVNQVLTSEYCRAKEYAQLSVGSGEVEPSLVLPDPLPAEVRQANTAAFQRLLATPPPPGANVVFVSHSPNIRDAAGVDLPVEGEAAILQPNPGTPPTPVARILPDEWPALAQALGNR